MTGHTGSSRWAFVAGVGIASGALLGWLVTALTASVIAGVVGGVAIASILVVLAIGGFRQNAVFNDGDRHEAAALARRAKVQEAMRASREGGSAPDADEPRR